MRGPHTSEISGLLGASIACLEQLSIHIVCGLHGQAQVRQDQIPGLTVHFRHCDCPKSREQLYNLYLASLDVNASLCAWSLPEAAF